MSTKTPIKATNATYDKLQNQSQEGLNTTYNFEGSTTVESNGQETVNVQVPYMHDNPNSTFDIPVHDAVVANATFTTDETGTDNTNCNETNNLRKKTYAVPPGSSAILRTNDGTSNEPMNINLNNLTYNNCDISDISESRSNIQTRHPIASKHSNIQKLSRDSSQGKYLNFH